MMLKIFVWMITMISRELEFLGLDFVSTTQHRGTKPVWKKEGTSSERT